MYAANAILAALYRREQTGEGATIDLALFDVQLAMLANQASNALVSGRDPVRQGRVLDWVSGASRGSRPP